MVILYELHPLLFHLEPVAVLVVVVAAAAAALPLVTSYVNLNVMACALPKITIIIQQYGVRLVIEIRA